MKTVRAGLLAVFGVAFTWQIVTAAAERLPAAGKSTWKIITVCKCKIIEGADTEEVGWRHGHDLKRPGTS